MFKIFQMKMDIVEKELENFRRDMETQQKNQMEIYKMSKIYRIWGEKYICYLVAIKRSLTLKTGTSALANLKSSTSTEFHREKRFVPKEAAPLCRIILNLNVVTIQEGKEKTFINFFQIYL